MTDVNAHSGARRISTTILAAIVVSAACLLLLGVTSQDASASTTLSPVVEQALSDGTLLEYARRNGAAGTTAPTCGEICTKLVAEERAPMPNSTAQKVLWRDKIRVLVKTRLWPSIGVMLERFSPHIAFQTGFAIGTVVNQKWLRINLPETGVVSGPQWELPPTHAYQANYYPKG